MILHAHHTQITPGVLRSVRQFEKKFVTPPACMRLCSSERRSKSSGWKLNAGPRIAPRLCCPPATVWHRSSPSRPHERPVMGEHELLGPNPAKLIHSQSGLIQRERFQTSPIPPCRSTRAEMRPSFPTRATAPMVSATSLK